MDIGWIWRIEVHPQVSLFLWKVTWRWLPTRYILRIRGMDIQPVYLVYCREEEIIEHILFLYLRAVQAWHLVGIFSFSS